MIIDDSMRSRMWAVYIQRISFSSHIIADPIASSDRIWMAVAISSTTTVHDVDKYTLFEKTRKNYLRAAELGSKEPPCLLCLFN